MTIREITVQILGTICLVNAPTETFPFKKRLVLPFDKSLDPEDQHIPFVEFLEKDIGGGSNLSSIYQRPKNKGEIDYRRFNLAGHVVEIENVVADPFVVKQSYDKHIPKMKQVATSLDPKPRKDCFDNEPKDPTLIAGFFDVSWGTLKAAMPLYEYFTRFEISTGHVVHTVHSAKFSELLIRVETPIKVNFKRGGTTITIPLKDDTDVISIGNLPLDMIEGYGGGDDVRHHFGLYYELADPINKPADPPLPKEFALVVNACSNTNWP
jgi:hypothetical protein